MGCIKLKQKESVITPRKAEQMRTGICLGELAYNFKLKGDLEQARRIMVKASRSSKYVYLAAIHALATRLDKGKRVW